MSTKPYTGSTIYNSNGDKFYVNGPGNGFGYHAGTLWPHLQYDTEQQARIAAEVANIAYEQGYAAAQRDIKNALGIC